ncbi:hypothetical protein VZT92_000531 [Zoarces viviparus]|uniref:Uncharacterized protein n=1 Tax=Zoarces viviparus TaxID=48416 RepID=A0AAW1G7B1_ZOAVI
MEVIPEEVEHPIHFYLSSLEERVRCELLDSEARITQTKIKDRILLEIDEDRLQHFLDIVHEKTKEEMEISKMFCQANAKQELKNGHLQWQEEKSSYQAQMDEQRAETNRIAAALKETQDLLETERQVQPKTITEEEMEVFKNFCQAAVDEQFDVSSKLKEDLDNAKQELKNGHLQWQEEKSSYQAQLYEQRAETNRIAAALKETQDLLETEHKVQPKTTTDEEMEVFKNLCQAAVDEQFDVSSKLKEDLDKAKQELETIHLQWQQERFNATARQLKDSDYFHWQMHIMASYRAHEQEAAKQNLEKAQAFYQAQMDQQRVETNRIAAALKETQDLLETERHVQPKTTTEEETEVFKNFCQAAVDEQFDVSSKLKEDLDKAKRELETIHFQWQQERFNATARQLKDSDYFHWQMHIMASYRAHEHEAAKQNLEKAQAFYQAQMDQQGVETNRIAAALKETQDLLETERQVQPKTTMEEEMEVFKNFCQAAVDEQLYVSSKLKADLDNAKQELKNGHLQWQEEKSSYQAQMDEQRAETNRIAAALKETQDLLETERQAQPKTTTEEEMEVFKNFCQAAVDEQLYVSSKLKADLDNAKQELKKVIYNSKRRSLPNKPRWTNREPRQTGSQQL